MYKLWGFIIWVPFDGIGGGNNQLGHLASTYAAILTLILTDQYELLDNLRELIRDWLLTLKNEVVVVVGHHL